MSFDPWAWVEYHRTPILRTRLAHARAYTDGHHVWLDTALTRTEARCSLTHEIVHLMAGHCSHQAPKEEWKVRAHTAQLLIPDIEVVQSWWGDVWQLADELDVTPCVIRDRVRVWERTGV